MQEREIKSPFLPNNTPQYHLVEEAKNLHSMLFNSLVPSIRDINTTIRDTNQITKTYIQSTEKLSRNTFWLNIVIAISA